MRTVSRGEAIADTTGELRLRAQSESDGACLLWLGHVNHGGYGQMTIGGKQYSVHRLSYINAKGPIPDHLELDHTCAVRNCILPDHLEAVTHAENQRRMGLRAVPVTHCVAGHPFDAKNTRLDKRGRRVCRACSKTRDVRKITCSACRVTMPRTRLRFHTRQNCEAQNV